MKAAGLRLQASGLLLAAACAHAALPAAQPLGGPSREELAKVAVSVAPETIVNDPVLQDRGAQLRAALAKAFADEGFKVVEQGGLLATTSIDYTPWTAVSAASLYIVVALKNEGVSVDQVEDQKINEDTEIQLSKLAIADKRAQAERQLLQQLRTSALIKIDESALALLH